jgi:hypothetical protein
VDGLNLMRGMLPAVVDFVEVEGRAKTTRTLAELVGTCRDSREEVLGGSVIGLDEDGEHRE